MKKLAYILLGVWLVLTGLISLAVVNFRGSSTLLAVVAVVTGALLLLADRNEKLSARAPELVLGIWLILAGLVPLIHIRFRGINIVLEVLAVVAGVLVLIKR